MKQSKQAAAAAAATSKRKAHKEEKEIPAPILYFFDTRTVLDARAETFLFFPFSPSSPVSGHPEKPSSHDIATIGFLRASLGFWERGFFWVDAAFQETMFSFFFALTTYRRKTPTPLVGGE